MCGTSTIHTSCHRDTLKKYSNRLKTRSQNSLTRCERPTSKRQVKKKSYINLISPINSENVQRLINVIRNKLRNGFETFTIIISSPRGDVNSGITAYNFLKGIPAEVITHNIGIVHSIAVVIFCAGSKRHCSPNSQFLIHGIGFNAKEGQRFNEVLLGERLENMKNQRITISKIISENSKKSLKENRKCNV